LLKYIDETGMYLEINGFRKVEIGDPTNFLKDLRRLVPKGNFVQFFDAELIATWQHLYFAALNALLAFKDGNNISKTAQMEIVLYSAAQRQIEKAIKAENAFLEMQKQMYPNREKLIPRLNPALRKNKISMRGHL